MVALEVVTVASTAAVVQDVAVPVMHVVIVPDVALLTLVTLLDASVRRQATRYTRGVISD